MDHHKVLYKDHRLHTPRHYNRINRELQEENRNKHRRNRFQNSRNISPSPIRTQKEIIIPLPTEKNDNLQENSSRLAKIVSNTNDPEKITKQEAFIKRFVAWMDNKKIIKQQEVTNRKKPFVSAVNSNRQTTTSCSLVPKGHHEGFVPPAGLKNPVENKKVVEDKNNAKKKRVSIYTVVPTPPRKKFNGKTTTENKKTLRKSPEKISRAKEAAVSFKRPVEKAKKNITSATNQAHLKKELTPRALIMLTPQPPSTDTNTVKKQTGALTKIKSMAPKRAEIRKKSPLKSGGARLAQTLKAKKPLNTSKKVILPCLQINGQKLLKNIKKKQMEEDLAIQTPKDFATSNIFDEFVTSTRIKNSSQIMEDVKSISPIKTYKKSHGNSSAKRNIMLDAINTTQIKESEENKENPTNKVKKFNFIRYSEAANLSINDNNKKQNEELKAKEGNVCSNENNITLVDNSKVYEKTPTKSGADDRPANYLSPYVSVARGKVNLKKEKEKRNSIYLQNTAEHNNLQPESTSSDPPPPPPMYSVEVRRTLEAVRYFRKQLQDEINRLHKKCDIWEKYKAENLEKIQNANGEDMINVTIGQTRLLTSKKFMQFKGLIDRCEAGATDIGLVKYDGSENTKPVVSADLEGFWSILGLQVDNLDQRFENLNRWKLNDWNDPDKVMPEIKKNLTKVKKTKTVPAAKAKPNPALQQMLRKMKAEMRKNKPEENEDVALKISKPKTRRSASSNNSTPRKSIDIVVKDRKYFSHAATVISISSPNRRVSTQPQKSCQDSPKILKHIQKFNEALDTTQSSSGLRRSVLIKSNSRRMSLITQSPLKDRSNNDPKMLLDFATPKNKDNVSVNSMTATSHSTLPSELSPPRSPVRTARKSILKTPGTAKSRLHNVIFNEKLRVKKFNFLINDEEINAENGEDADHTHEEDLAKSYEEELQSTDSPQRTLILRNRKVRLRPSCEIVLPKANSR